MKTQSETTLPASETAEALGIPSAAILDYLEYLEQKKLCIHSVILLRHGKTAFEAYYPPFTGESLHRMYSATKSFVSMAVGFMIDEGKLTLKSRPADFFPEYLTEPVHPFIKEMTVRDLLLMATPYSKSTYTVEDKNWVKTFFTAKATHKGGTAFSYDTSGTVTLNALVEKISGLNLFEYLWPRLLKPLGFSKETWCVERPEGGAWGGSGLLSRTRDLANFGLFLLNRGKWQGKQLLSASYLDEACSPQIDNRITTASPEMQFGYGYQIWRTRHNGFCAWGMGSQIALCLPEKDLVLAVNGDTQAVTGSQDMLLDGFWRLIYPRLSDTALPPNADDTARLNRKTTNLEFPAVEGEPVSPEQSCFNGKKYLFDDNALKITWASFEFSNGFCSMNYENSSGVHELRIGIGGYLEGVFPETHYFDRKIGVPSGRGLRYKASGAWFNPVSFTFYLYIIDNCFGSLKVNCFFDDTRLTLAMSKTAEWFLDEYTGVATGNRAPQER